MTLLGVSSSGNQKQKSFYEIFWKNHWNTENHQNYFDFQLLKKNTSIWFPIAAPVVRPCLEQGCPTLFGANLGKTLFPNQSISNFGYFLTGKTRLSVREDQNLNSKNVRLKKNCDLCHSSVLCEASPESLCGASANSRRKSPCTLFVTVPRSWRHEAELAEAHGFSGGGTRCLGNGDRYSQLFTFSPTRNTRTI